MVIEFKDVEEHIRKVERAQRSMRRGVNALLVGEEQNAYLGSVWKTIPRRYGEFDYLGKFKGRMYCFSFYFQEGMQIKLLGESAKTWPDIEDEPHIFRSIGGNDDCYWFQPTKSQLFVGDESIRSFLRSRPEIYLRAIADGKPYWAGKTWDQDLLRRVYSQAINHMSSFNLSRKPKDNSPFFSRGRGEHLSMFDY